MSLLNGVLSGTNDKLELHGRIVNGLLFANISIKLNEHTLSGRRWWSYSVTQGPVMLEPFMMTLDDLRDLLTDDGLKVEFGRIVLNADSRTKLMVWMDEQLERGEA